MNVCGGGDTELGLVKSGNFLEISLIKAIKP